MKLLILGAQGMAGHVIAAHFVNKSDVEIFTTSRDAADKNSIYLDAKNFPQVEAIITQIKPDIIINCIGMLNQDAENHMEDAFLVNGMLPQRLVYFADKVQAKVIHISTDCVFLGDKGDYTDEDMPDGKSIYSISKQLGEITTEPHVTVRTSIIGPELKTDGIGLLLWFMKQKGKINGYKNVYWNGITTLELAKVVEYVIEHDIRGLFQVGGKKISKYDLLREMQTVFQKEDVEILPELESILDRTIVSTRTDFHYTVPSYKQMLTELKDWMNDSV